MDFVEKEMAAAAAADRFGGHYTKSRIWLSDVTFTFHFHALEEKDLVTHSSILAWEIPWTEEPGELQSMGLQESDTMILKPK